MHQVSGCLPRLEIPAEVLSSSLLRSKCAGPGEDDPTRVESDLSLPVQIPSPTAAAWTRVRLLVSYCQWLTLALLPVSMSILTKNHKLVVIILHGSRSQQSKNPGRDTLGDRKFRLMSLALGGGQQCLAMHR